MASPLATAFVRIRPDTKGFGSELKRDVSRGAGDAGQTAGKHFSRGWGGGIKGIAAATAGAFAILKGAAVVSGFLSSSLDEARESVKVGKLTEQVIKTTGGAARVSAKDIGALADALSRKTGIDDEVIQSGENLLLTFTNIRNETGKGNDVFNQATLAVQDMSVALGQDTKSSAIQLGKALQDPVKGVTALRRVGVMLTDAQKDQIKAFVESGDTMSAQKVILGELTKEFGGAAEAAATPADKARVAWKNFKEDIGTKLLPVMNRLSDWFTKTAIPAAQGLFDLVTGGNFADDFTKAFGIDEKSGLVKFLTKARDVIKSIISWIGDHKAEVAGFAAAWIAIPAALSLVAAAFAINPFTLILLAISGLVALVIHLWKTNEKFRDNVIASWERIKASWNNARDRWAEVVASFTRKIAEIRARWEAIFTLINKTKIWFSDLKDHVIKTWDKIVAGAKSMVGAIRGFFTRMPGQIRTWIGNTAILLLGKGRDLIIGLRNGIANIMATINQWLYYHVKKPVVDAFAKAKDWLYSHGGNVIAGLLSGIRNKIAGIGRWIKTYVVDPIVGAVKRFFGIKSPATVMQPLGKNIALGLIKGIIAVNPVRVVSKIFGSMPAALAGIVNKGIVSLSSLPSKALGAITGFFGGLSGAGGGAAAIGQQLAAMRGWVGEQWTALFRLWQGESGWNPLADNPTSTAFGIPQFLASTARAYGVYGSTDPAAQILAGMRYISDVYGTPANAYSAWLSRWPHWYDSGGWLPTGVTLAVNDTGRPERVLSPRESDRLGGRTYVINQHLVPGVHPAEVGRQTVLAIQAFERGNGSEWRTR